MSHEVQTARPDTRLLEVARLMYERVHSCVVIAERSRPLGIITERDLVRAVTTGHEFQRDPARRWMSTPLITVDGSAPIDEARRRCERHGVRRLLVVDDGGLLCGLITQRDLLNAHADMLAQERASLEEVVQARTSELEAANRQLEALTLEDTLTSIGNRRAMELALQQAHDRFVRYGEPYAVIILDLDHFKAYNDTYGHLAGDEALQRVSRCVQDLLRRPDRVYRYGGEELLVILPGTDAEGALVTARRLLGYVRDLGIAHEGNDSGLLTVSAGVAEAADGGWHATLSRSDQALYRAKQQGRDRVAR